MFKRILVPLDGSKFAETAVEYAADLAKMRGATLILLRAAESPMTAGFSPETPIPQELFEAGRKKSEEYLAGVRNRLPGGVRVRIEVPVGDPAECILGFAQQEDCDLIVMASHGHTGVKRFLLGSVADKVSRHARCPVLMVGRAAKAASGMGA